MNKVAATLAIALILTGCGSAEPAETAPATTATSTPTDSTTTTTPAATTTTETPETTATTTTTTTTTAAPVDDTPPELVVTYPADGVTLADSEVVFTGTSEPGIAEVWSLPSTEATVDADGNWSVLLSLESGDNTATFSARDEAGNETVVGITVRYTAPMPCDLFTVQAEHVSAFPLGPKDWCGGWGYIESASATEIVFDLAQVDLNVPGDESQGWSIVNANPMLRYLPLSSAVEIRACPPVPGDPAPGICGSPWVGAESWEFSLWAPTDLVGFVGASDELWKVLVDASGEVVWIEQWWTP